MKRCIVAAICMLAASQAHAEPIWVQVRQSQVRSQPKFYAQSLGPVQTRMEDVLQGRNPSDPFASRPEVGQRLRDALRGTAP